MQLIQLHTFFFLHSGGAAWGRSAQAPPRMKKTEKQISLRTFDTKVLNLRSRKSYGSELARRVLAVRSPKG